MTSTFLTPEEVAELTGKKRASSQIFWLRINAFKFWVNAANKPVVPRSAIDGIKEDLAGKPSVDKRSNAWNELNG